MYIWFFLSDGELGPNDLLPVLRELHEVRAKWELIGLGLQISPGTLEAIKRQHHDDPQYCLMEVLKEWLKSLRGPSWEVMTDVLSDRTIGAERLSRDLRTKFGIHVPPDPLPGMHSILYKT